MSTRFSPHNEYQRRYYSRPGRTARMLPVRSPYVLRHFEAVLDALELGAGARVLEVGCGLGRFTRLFLERGFAVTAVDLSPDLLADLEARHGEGLRVVCCDAEEVDRHVEGPFDAAVGFFFLHHLEHPEHVFASVAATLRPGGRIAFCEPNAFNPLFYLQILLTPGMTFRGDGGVARMRRGPVFRALRRAGCAAPRLRRYGLFPPAIANTRMGAGLERWLERRRALEPLLAFQVFSGVVTKEGENG